MFGIGGIGVWIGHELPEPTGESRLAGVAGVGDDTDRLVEVDGDNPIQRGPNRPRLSVHRERVHVGVWAVDLGGFDERDADSDGVGCPDCGVNRLATRRGDSLRIVHIGREIYRVGEHRRGDHWSEYGALAGLVDAEVHASLVVSDG